MEDQEFDYQVNLTISDVRLLHHSVLETIKYWPGAPARPYQEQEHLWYMRDSLFRIIMDYNFTQK
ncbi:MAG: hypothetical protein CMA57_00645 [Euryarchaeota archaeon]|nr:hypothetical protein [Euryarchaeota archaeon]